MAGEAATKNLLIWISWNRPGSREASKAIPQRAPEDSFAATCMYQLVSERYEIGSIILTSNKSYGDWGQIFADNVIASTILVQLLHHSTTINIKGESYRLTDKKKASVIDPKTAPKEAA